MKFVEPRPFADPEVAASKLVEIAGVEAVQDGRVYIERVNARRGAGQSPAHRKTRRRVESAGGRYKANVTAFRTVTLRREGPRSRFGYRPSPKGQSAGTEALYLAIAARAFAPGVWIGHRSSVQPRLPLATTWSFKPA